MKVRYMVKRAHGKFYANITANYSSIHCTPRVESRDRARQDARDYLSDLHLSTMRYNHPAARRKEDE